MEIDEDRVEYFRRNEDPDDIPILKLSLEEVGEFALKMKMLMAEKKNEA